MLPYDSDWWIPTEYNTDGDQTSLSWHGSPITSRSAAPRLSAQNSRVSEVTTHPLIPHANCWNRSRVSCILNELELEDVRRCKGKKFVRRRFYAAGVMAVLTMDQHDKWGQYHLWLHVGIDPFSGYITWLKIWRTNHNPSLIAKYYLDAIQMLGGTICCSCSRFDAKRQHQGLHSTRKVTKGLRTIQLLIFKR